MADSSKLNKVTSALSTAGKSTLKGVGIFAVGTVKVLGEMADASRRQEIREKLNVISDYDLEIAAEIIAERIKNKRK